MRIKIIEPQYTFFDRLQIKIINFVNNQAVIAITLFLMLILLGSLED